MKNMVAKVLAIVAVLGMVVSAVVFLKKRK